MPVTNLFLDIETIPAPEQELDKVRYLYEKIRSRRAKKLAVLDEAPVETEEDKRKYSLEEYIKNTGFDGAFGRILCIAYAIDDCEVEVLSDPDNEKRVLVEFWEIAKQADCFVGHNIIEFDLRFIWQRSVKLGVRPSWQQSGNSGRVLNFARYRNFPIYDTMKEWTKWGSVKDPGLEHIALALGLESPKDGIDGSMVWDFFKAGKIAEICGYCKRDVETTRAIYRKMTFQTV